MNLLGNIIWLIFGGLFIALEYLIASIILFVSIIGIPFGIQTLKMAGLALYPFGRDTRVRGNSTGCLYTLFNILWLFTGGLLICLSHIFWGVILALTIIGIPFAQQHFKLASLALTSFGRDIYSK
jgi:uncharacterized membrane protein YccF (DUF307 family)